MSHVLGDMIVTQDVILWVSMGNLGMDGEVTFGTGNPTWSSHFPLILQCNVSNQFVLLVPGRIFMIADTFTCTLYELLPHFTFQVSVPKSKRHAH